MSAHILPARLSWAPSLLVGALLFACGGDDDDTTDDAPTSASSNGSSSPVPTTAGGGGAPSGDRGSATLVIGDETWEFAAFSCAFGHDATRSDTFSFSSDARGEHSTGARVQMQANITDDDGDGRYEGDGVEYEVYIADIQDFTNPAVKWSSRSDFRLAPGETVIRIDGNNLTAEGNFDDELTEDVFEAVPGTLTAVCGSQSIR